MAEHKHGRYEISSVNFGDDVATIVYMHVPGDVRADGALVATHNLSISATHIGWADDVLELRDRVHDLLVDALEDFAGSEPVDLADLNDPDGDDERELGMGDR